MFLARDNKLGRRVAIKFLISGQKRFGDRFTIEARATARCQHENIVVIYEADEWQGKPYMALEYLEGEALARQLDGGKTLAPSRAIELIVQVVRALARAHELEIVRFVRRRRARDHRADRHHRCLGAPRPRGIGPVS